ncbi:hypothetical protein BDY21DRAFT_351936 [Lineolata rhizophorae]|uniref:AAA+ ATPase domain-containing protein n=1 Tax=Lineolata rhizophorae TaxID=578093 RepID=A0A6A6NT67_9PEZI|nr:hypothetical protein BDY21DRAFT_351936 [Lineolata rhizophorae]
MTHHRNSVPTMEETETSSERNASPPRSPLSYSPRRQRSFLRSRPQVRRSSKVDGYESRSPSDASTDYRYGPSNEAELKLYEEAKKHAIRKGGTVYLPSEVWGKYEGYSLNSHLCVSLTSTSFFLDNNAQDTDSHSPGSHQPSQELSKSSDHARARCQHIDRVAIINKPLEQAIRQVNGNSVADVFHRPPFRCIVPYEQKFREMYRDKEAEFKRLAAEHPNHPSISREDPSVPESMTFTTKVFRDGDGANLEEMDRTRILLDGLKALIAFLDHDIVDLVETHRKIMSRTIEKIPFPYLWHLFVPGQEVISTKPVYQVYRVINVMDGRRALAEGSETTGAPGRNIVEALTIQCMFFSFDGQKFGPTEWTISIKPYDNDLDINSLEAYPLWYKGEGLEKDLIRRGKKFAELVQVTHRRYKGLSVGIDGLERPEEIESDVIIDPELGFRDPSSKIEASTFLDFRSLSTLGQDAQSREYLSGSTSITFEERDVLKSRMSGLLNETDLLDVKQHYEMDRNHWILLPYSVLGYVLLNRKWYLLNIDLIEEVDTVKEGGPDGFDDLILPPGHKDIVRALVKTHARAQRTPTGSDMKILSQRELDLVKGKGKGLIILLHGAPGVGKTSTAECVAANTGRPLFPITCGDIGGTTAQEVESNLEKFFDLARKWGCVLLLDEADVFLSERQKGDIRQNSLVSVFLRVLEYYSGILILTTNRVGEFDEAIKSRVHCPLYYPPLNKKNTLGVWQMNLERLERKNKGSESKLPVVFDQKEIMDFAKRHWKAGNRWNGRQIKNAFQTAIALADWDNLKREDGSEKRSSAHLERRHFEKVAEASAHFERYLTIVRSNQSDQARARAHEWRRDDYADELSERARRKKKSTKGKKVATKIPWPALSSEDDSDSDTSDSSSATSETESESEPVKKRRGHKRGKNKKAKKTLSDSDGKAKNAGKKKGKAKEGKPVDGSKKKPSKKEEDEADSASSDSDSGSD